MWEEDLGEMRIVEKYGLICEDLHTMGIVEKCGLIWEENINVIYVSKKGSLHEYFCKNTKYII